VVSGGREKVSLAVEIEQNFNVIIEKFGGDLWQSGDGQPRLREVVARCTGRPNVMPCQMPLFQS
jgi:hypothetical protein